MFISIDLVFFPMYYQWDFDHVHCVGGEFVLHLCLSMGPLCVRVNHVVEVADHADQWWRPCPVAVRHLSLPSHSDIVSTSAPIRHVKSAPWPCGLKVNCYTKYPEWFTQFEVVTYGRKPYWQDANRCGTGQFKIMKAFVCDITSVIVKSSCLAWCDECGELKCIEVGVFLPQKKTISYSLAWPRWIYINCFSGTDLLTKGHLIATACTAKPRPLGKRGQ